MKSPFKEIAILLVGIAGTAAVFMMLAKPAPDAADDKYAALQQSAEDTRQKLGQQVLDVQAENQTLETELEAAQARIAELETRPEPNSALTEDEGETEVPDDNESGEDPPPTLQEIRDDIAANAMARTQLKAITGLVYADLLNALDIEPAAKETLKALFEENQLDSVALQQYVARAGNITARQFFQWQDEDRARLNADVRELLNDENYAAYEQFDANIDQRAMEVSLDPQIRALSSGLSPENHDYVVAVAGEEFVNEFYALRDSDEIYTRQEPFLFQLRAMENMRERLQPTMAEDQYRELENFLTMADRLLTQQMPPDEDE